MRFYAYVIFTAVMLIGWTSDALSTAAISETSRVNGHFEISLSDELSKVIDFTARIEADGSSSGEMTFREADSRSHPTDETIGPAAKLPFFFKANFDCLLVAGNKAIMSGSISEASLDRYVGKRVMLVVQDNGHGLAPGKHDRLTWGIYQPAVGPQLATDAERPDDRPGATWVATDAERPEDAGILSRQDPEISCQTFPLSAFSFISAKHGHGQIYVMDGKAISRSSK